MSQIDFSRLEKNKQTNCPCCNKIAAEVMSLPKYPITEFYKDISDVTPAYGFFDQEALFCEPCNHLFLKNILDAQQIYRIIFLKVIRVGEG
jgi:hypothetical protein